MRPKPLLRRRPSQKNSELKKKNQSPERRRGAAAPPWVLRGSVAGRRGLRLGWQPTLRSLVRGPGAGPRGT